jgi:hypothetical protein
MIIAYYPGAGGNRFLKKTTRKEWATLGISYDSQVHDQLFLHRYLLQDGTPQAQTEYTLTHCMNSTKIQQMFPKEPIIFINSNLQQSLRREWSLAGHSRFVTNKMQKKIKIARLDHYNAIKDATWPSVDCIEQLEALPNSILEEVNRNYYRVNSNIVDTPDILLELTQTYIDQINSSYEIIKWHLDYYQTFPVDFSAAEKIVEIDSLEDEFSLLMKQELDLYQNPLFDQVWEKING